MSEALEGEVVGAAVARAPQGLAFTTYAVDLRTGGQVGGMDYVDAVAIAKALGTRVLAARAVLIPETGLVIVESLSVIWRP